MSEVYIRSQNKEKLYRLGGNYACVEYGEYEDIKKKRGGAEADKKRHVICISDGCLEEIGEYATKERCLEVLDEIQKACVSYLFTAELSATLVYEYGGFKRVIDCRAYGEPKILKKEVLYEFDLQIECLNPFWREEEETKEDIASWVAAWHFPCVIEKDSTKSMIYGYRAESVIVDCYNEGDVSTGMRIRFTALGTVSNPILLNVDTEEFIQINATMKTGDVIEINTKYGSKGAKLIRDGVETDYFRYIDVDSGMSIRTLALVGRVTLCRRRAKAQPDKRG